MFQNGVPEVSPPNAEPLLLAAEVTAYSTSERPCGPLLRIPPSPASKVTATAMPTSSRTGVAST